MLAESVVAAAQGLQQANVSGLTVTTVGNDPVLAAEACAQADVCLFVMSVYAHEGDDRLSLTLSLLQEAYLDLVLPSAKQSLVVLHLASAVDVSAWVDKCTALLTTGYPGQTDGLALADVLLGVSPPSGRLTLTWPLSAAQLAFSPQQWPGQLSADPCVNECRSLSPRYSTMTYSEGQLFGYRYFNAKNILPRFSFGFGLSYTNFSYSHFALDSSDPSQLSFTCVVANTGSWMGADVVQLYVAFPSRYQQAPKQLKGFAKTLQLNSAESANVEIILIPNQELLVWSTPLQKPVPAVGNFTAFFASSASRVLFEIDFTV